ncbi:uncharacterized protein LOC117173204 [Belonocnema kinseyi]|uniref:uncharacterized protein LOC117173204 n=1 Tax=Belonocnema kinseyi TaxID=2817044 RepID=UPI00143D8EFE|nr:uncharacterized protein LOC117173204 [Belonocnema kinseyi]
MDVEYGIIQPGIEINPEHFVHEENENNLGNTAEADDSSEASLRAHDEHDHEDDDDDEEDLSSVSTDPHYSSSDNEEYAGIFPDNEAQFIDQPLFQGSPVTLMESMLLILTVLLHHNVTMTCLSDIIAPCAPGLKVYFPTLLRNEIIKPN